MQDIKIVISKIKKAFTLQLYSRFIHYIKIRAYKNKYGNTTSHHSTWTRVFLVILFVYFSVFIYSAISSGCQNLSDCNFGFHFDFISSIDELKDNKSILNLYQLIITAPILFIVWLFRDQNKLKELHNARKNTNLAEFQKLQQWATGNIDGNNDNNKNAIALQISALHSLRNYLKGEFGDDFRRGAFEIFASTLHTQHQILLDKCKENGTKIKEEIEQDELTKQINRIAEEEWFNLLVNHSFPTATISLVGVNLQGTYLKHLDFGKRIDLSKSNLQEADLRYANLQKANLWYANLKGSNLERANIESAHLFYAKLQSARLFYTNLQGAFLLFTNLQEANLMYANLQGTDLIHANLKGANLMYANLQKATLEDANLQGATLEDANLQGATLERTKLQGTYLKNVNLVGADLSHTELQGASSERLLFLSFEERISEQIEKETSLEEEKVNLENAQIGTYTEEEAKKWVDEFNKSKDSFVETSLASKFKKNN